MLYSRILGLQGQLINPSSLPGMQSGKRLDVTPSVSFNQVDNVKPALQVFVYPRYTQ